MKEGKKAPKLRFKGFTDDWEQRMLGDVADRVTRKNKGTVSELPLTISAQDGLISQDEFFNKKVASKDLSSYLLLHHGDFAYNKSYSNGYPFGTIKRLEKYPQGVVSSLYIAFKPNSRISSDFMAQYYESNNWHKEIYKCAAEGARNHGLLNVPPSDFFATDLNSPIKKSEQLKIGRLLNAVDHTITLHEEKKRQLERLKSALLQKMFADKSRYPAVRFNGFRDEWKKQKLGDIVETITDYVAAGSFASLRENVIYRSEPCYAQLIRTADLKSNFSKIAPVYVDKQAFDFLYRVSLDKESVILPNIGNCGEVYYVDPHELPYMRNVLGPNAILIRSSSLNNHFLSVLFQSHNFQKSLKLIISPNGQTKFNKTELKRIKMVLPMDVNEQNSLSAFFKMINTAISLQEHKSNILKDLKSSLLQKMFI